MRIGQECAARLQLQGKKRMSEQLRHGRLPPPYPREILRRRRERGGKTVTPHARMCRTEILIERRAAEDVEIPIGRALLAQVGTAVHRGLLPLSAKTRQMLSHDAKICLRKDAAPLEPPMPQHEHGKEQEQKAAEHQLLHRTAVIAVKEGDQHQREHRRTRKNEPRSPCILCMRVCKGMLTHIFIKVLLHEELLEGIHDSRQHS